MYIVKKKINGKDYYYLRKSVREGKNVKSVNIAYLGKSKEEAEKKMKELDKEKIKNPENKDKKMEEKKEQKRLTIEELASFCKRKALVYPSSEIYGGLAGFWDFGPIGVELLGNIKKSWWKYFVNDKENIVGLDASLISHPKTWVASGHVSSFADVGVVCKKCKKATKIDKSEVGKAKCDCGGEFEVQGEFNLLFKTTIGALNPVEAYLRGETAQGMFLNFKNIASGRVKLPFGIAQIGKCFRNEIAPRDFLFRSREFTIAEFEFFIHPEEKKCDLLKDHHLELKIRLLDAETQDKGKEELTRTTIGKMIKENKLEEWHGYWLSEQLMWYKEIGLNMDLIKIREHMKDELSHYSSATFDIDFEFPFGSKELGGNANRGQYDLTQHSKESGESMEIFDEASKKKVLPRVIEPTFGIERAFLAVLSQAYEFDSKRNNIVLMINKKIAPYKAAIFPIVKVDEKVVKISREIYEELKKDFVVAYDDGGSLGRRYSRQDEIGTPYCITIDGDSVKGKDCTIRDRDSTKQIRVKISEVKEIIRKLINSEIEFDKAGKTVETRVKE